jgi:hypothetical protein
VFGKKTSDSGSATSVTDDSLTVTASAASAPKGRPTPTRKEAEANRKATLTGTAKPGATKKETKALSREQMQEARAKSREAMLRGDQSALPARDKGPVKLYVRDFVDSRRTVAEFFVPIAVVVLLLGLLQSQQLQVFATLVWFVIIILVVVDTSWWLYKLHSGLGSKFKDKADRKGVTFYAIMRALQIRKLRLPPTRFKAGGVPVDPIVTKNQR